MSLARRCWSRGFRRVVERAPAQAKKKGETGRDPYALFKQAILAPQDEEKVKQAPAVREGEARKEDARLAMAQHHEEMAHLTRLIKLRQAALDALPPELQEEARKPDFTLLPIERRVFTETPPIPDFQKKLSGRDNTD